jgi:cell division inhibitor SepF
MSGTMRKLGLYLGLVEDDEEAGRAGPPLQRRRLRRRRPRAGRRDEPPLGAADDLAPTTALRRAPELSGSVRTRGSVALDTSLRAAPAPVHDEGYRITTLHPRTYNEARQIGEHFRNGTPVIMNLTEMDDTDAKRLVDFAAGLIFGLHGSIERVTAKVFLLSPEHVQVTAEDKARIAESGFFNQS